MAGTYLPKKYISFEEARKKLEGYCSYQERCHKEVVQKLREMRLPKNDMDKIMVHLINENYLNEERFAQSFARGKFNIKKWGRTRIISELKQRDISKYNINIALKEIQEADYHQTFHTLAEKKWDSLKEPSQQRKKRKLADYLLYRGWESELVYEKISELSPR